MKDTKKITEKVKKLLAMADSDNGATEQERETALRQATYLMDRHAIDIDTLSDDLSDPRGKDSVEINAALWRPLVFSAVGKLYGCVVYMQKTPKGKRITVIGRESARVTVITLAAWIITNIEKEVKSRDIKRAGGRRDSFLKGAAAGVFDTVDKINEARERGETIDNASKALVVVESYKNELAENQDYLASEGVKLKTGKSLRTSSQGAFSQGKAYGSSLNLNPQVKGATVRRIGA